MHLKVVALTLRHAGAMDLDRVPQVLKQPLYIDAGDGTLVLLGGRGNGPIEAMRIHATPLWSMGHSSYSDQMWTSDIHFHYLLEKINRDNGCAVTTLAVSHGSDIFLLKSFAPLDQPSAIELTGHWAAVALEPETARAACLARGALWMMSERLGNTFWTTYDVKALFTASEDKIPQPHKILRRTEEDDDSRYAEVLFPHGDGAITFQNEPGAANTWRFLSLKKTVSRIETSLLDQAMTGGDPLTATASRSTGSILITLGRIGSRVVTDAAILLDAATLTPVGAPFLFSMTPLGAPCARRMPQYVAPLRRGFAIACEKGLLLLSDDSRDWSTNPVWGAEPYRYFGIDGRFVFKTASIAVLDEPDGERVFVGEAHPGGIPGAEVFKVDSHPKIQ